MTLTQQVGAFAATADSDRIPTRAREIAKLGFLDCVAVLVAGSVEPVVRILERTLLSDAPDGESSVCFSAHRTSSHLAALINGTAAHAIDYDDTSPGGHRSAVLVPAILAEGERRGASGRDMLCAYIVGFEVWSELLRREPESLHAKGWHPTGVYGAVAAATAIANLLRLDVEAATNAVGISASQAGGLVANFGTMTKPFHAGKAASAGVLAARLAVNGMTASVNALEHERGLLSAVSRDGNADLVSPSVLGAWRIVEQGIGIKKYPTCYGSHRAIDAVLEVLATRPVQAADVVEIEAHIGKSQAAILNQHSPSTVTAAKFSIEFALACAVLRRDVSLDHLNEEVVNDRAIRDLMQKVTVVPIEAHDPSFPGYSPYDQVRIRVSTGEILSSDKIKRPRGDVSVPLTPSELQAKFLKCFRYANTDLDAEKMFELLLRLDTLPAGWSRSLPRTGRTTTVAYRANRNVPLESP